MKSGRRGNLNKSACHCEWSEAIRSQATAPLQSQPLPLQYFLLSHAEVAEQADATVSKTVGGQPPCRFDPDLRHFRRLSFPELP